MTNLTNAPKSEAYDVIVIGSGAGGLSCAVTAAHQGLKVLVIEKAPVLGGTTAWSGGWIFAPRNPLAVQADIHEDIELPKTYLKTVLGAHFNERKIDAFLVNAPKMVEFFETKTELQFIAGNQIPDTYSHLPGAGQGGRSVIAAPYDGKKLGKMINLLRKPLPETAFMGMTIQAGPDLRAFMTFTQSWTSFFYVARRFGKHLFDLILHRRGMQLRNGNALVARLMKSAQTAGVKFLVQSPAIKLRSSCTRVSGVELATPTGTRVIDARYAVVLATGGFSQNGALVRQLFASHQTHRSLAVPEATGDGLRLAQSVGGYLDDSLASPLALCPVSEVSWPDGRNGVFPHIIERGKPGIIGVDRAGKRFCNEGQGYHDYVTALLERDHSEQGAESWLITTRAFQRKYGLGISRPAPIPLKKWIKRGYIVEAGSITELAEKCGIDKKGLSATINRWNLNAADFVDREYERGTNTYQRFQGDPTNQPNPCVAPIDKAPYLAVKVVPGSFASFMGIKTDEAARVLNKNGSIIKGL